MLISNLKISDVSFILRTKNNAINDFYDEEVKYKYISSKNLCLLSVTDIPFVAHKNIPQGKEVYVEMSKILHFYIVISDCELTDVIKPKNYEVYDSFSRLGFVIVDIEKFDDFISSRAQGKDLIDLFTTTELANEIFDEGMMILCWGNYPWLYYINSIQSVNDKACFGENTGYTGYYKFKQCFKNVSVIPGNELKDWGACKSKVWPVINLEGEGDNVELTLFLRTAFSQSDTGYPIPTFNLKRNPDKNRPLKPLLESDIFNNI